ncbi:hypothetical protein [Streptomyces sp. NPDC056491]|uniref:hypothetical protein n=1 Tax=Streptomyces sp. NPDC056491 TaxID=3345837 RepID=UPI0036A4EF28
MLERALRKNSAKITFALPADTPAAEVSVVGDFNAWRKDGHRAVTVQLPKGSTDQDGPNSRIRT